jgi:hypothetical protein
MSEPPGQHPAATAQRPGLKRRLKSWVVRNFLERGDLIETASEVKLDRYGLDTPDRFRYRATGRFVLPRLLRKIGIGPDDVFIDVGSGKGRMVFQAAKFPFKRVIGVELAEELTEVARYNIEHNRSMLACEDVELVTSDAVEYRFPDDVTIAFLYCPFVGETFERVIDNLIASLDRNPRELRLIYGYPLMVDYIHKTGRFELERRTKTWRPGIREFHEFLVFRGLTAKLDRSVPPASVAG